MLWDRQEPHKPEPREEQSLWGVGTRKSYVSHESSSRKERTSQGARLALENSSETVISICKDFVSPACDFRYHLQPSPCCQGSSL